MARVFYPRGDPGIRARGCCSAEPSGSEWPCAPVDTPDLLSPSPAWLLLVYGEERQHAGNLGYLDDPRAVYRYDSLVPNHLRVARGHHALLKAPDGILGFARVERIEQRTGAKTVRRCPECETTGFKERRTISPRFRCNDGHEFDQPRASEVSCELYAAHFGDSFRRPVTAMTFDARDACVQYNGNLAMQQLRPEVFERLARAHAPSFLRVFEYRPAYPPAILGSKITLLDHEHSILSRRGSVKLRDDLRSRYGDRCAITKCSLLDVIEAATISPYADAEDLPDNGLLLRSDLHTLFDLDLLGIEPEALRAELHPSVLEAGYADQRIHGARLELENTVRRRACLESRYSRFLARLDWR